jgi:hypothetical protein
MNTRIGWWWLLAAIVCLAEANSEGADVYTITSKTKKGETKTYDLTFGGSKTTARHVAFCPTNKKFVYLTWEYHKEKAPKPVLHIWDHRTGKTIPLYRFPGCKDPLPAIPSATDIKVCPFTGDTRLQIKRTGFDD